MSWVIAGTMAASTALSLKNQADQREQRKQEMLANAVQQQYSPWTGMKSDMKGYSGTGTATGAAAQGALAGAMMGSQFKGALAAKPTAPAEQAGVAQAGQGMASDGNPWAAGSDEANRLKLLQMGRGIA